MEKIVIVRWNYGGFFINDNNYNGGDVYIDQPYDIDRFSLFEFLAATRDLGYNTISGFYINGSNDCRFRHLYSDEVILEWVKELRDREIVDIFVEHRADKPQLHNPMQNIAQTENPFNTAHNSNNDYALNSEFGKNFYRSSNIVKPPNSNPNDPANPIPSGGPKTHSYNAATKLNESIVINNGANDVNSSVDINALAESITSDSSSEEEVELNDGEEEDVECDGDAGSEVDEELTQSRETIREYNKKRRERVVADVDDDIPLGETGIDIGFEYLGKSNEVYYDSSDPGSNIEDEEGENDEQPQLRKSTEKNRYDPNTPIPTFELRMVFTNMYEFREAVAKYSICKGKDLKKRPNDLHRVRVTCKKEGCPWLLYAGIEESTNDFIVKHYNPVHRCTRSNKNKLCTSKYIANYFRERIISQPGIKLREIVDLVREKLKVKVRETKCKRAKMLVLKSVIGDPLVEYARLHDYVEEIKKSNPGTACFVNYDDKNEPGKHLFKRFYVCFQATKQGWKDGVRKIIGLDGCFLKGPCQGQLLVAVSKDGNDQMFQLLGELLILKLRRIGDGSLRFSS